MSRLRVAERTYTSSLSYLIALASGGALALAFPEADIAPLGWVSIAPFLVMLEKAGWKRGLGLGAAFGVGFFGALLAWISLVGVLAYVLLVMIQAAFAATFGAIWGGLSTRLTSPASAVAGPVVAWVATVEYLRANVPLRGFPWGQLAQSQTEIPHLLKVTGLGGSWLLAALLLTVNALIAQAWLRRDGRIGRIVGAAALLVVPLLIPAPVADGEPVDVALVQGNVPQRIPDGREKQLAILHSHAELTSQLDDPDLVVWPESSIGIDPEREPAVGAVISQAARQADAPMIVGGNLDVPPDRYKVMAFLVGADGAFVDRYQKTHLVPFGEYVPGRAFLDWIPALDQVPTDAIPANIPTLFEVAGGTIAPVISFEGDFGSLVRDRIGRGGRLLIVATNTSTWGNSWASAQHVAMSRVRAAENGVYVLHAALSGISAIIAPSGEVLGHTALWTATTLEGTVRFATRVTPYARMGDWFAYFALATLAGMGVAAYRKRPAEAGTVPG